MHPCKRKGAFWYQKQWNNVHENQYIRQHLCLWHDSLLKVQAKRKAW